MAAASSSRKTLDGFEYDVFLSFRGTDTRGDFTGCLWKALDNKGIRTFFDQEDIDKGDEIEPSLRESIEKSKMALIVLSKNYASSAFCLNELSHIIECIRGNNRLVWPIFYDVEPSDVRWLENSYGEAMVKHEASSWYNTDLLEKWKKALKQVADLSGTHFKKGGKQLYKFIEEIVERVSTKIKPLTLHVAGNPVGLVPQVEVVISMLNLGYDDEVRMVGIHGIGGIGKTTLAVAVYNSIANQFQGSCYLENVRENFAKHGPTYLQNIILSEIVKEKKIELTSSKQGITLIQQRLRQKKVLLVLDDVNQSEQLEAIAGSCEWFGRGSRVIITSRDTGLLRCHEIEPYEVNELNEEDAFELLRQKALRTNEVTPTYMDVLNRALRYAFGLPLALEVIGSELYKKTVEECKYVLDRYESIPHPKIQTVLEVSFDALDREEKCVFLDIACVFKGHKLTDVQKILHAHYGDSKKHHIEVLVEKSLIKISWSGRVTLHDLIADMGEELVRRESPDDPGRRSRLWLDNDIVEVLEENRGTSKIEIIYFDSNIEVKWNGEAFKKMKNLKTLMIKYGTDLKSPKHLPNSLRVLEWWNYSGDLPSDFYPKKLVICNFYLSVLREDFFKKKFETMRILKVECCTGLTQIPDISGLRNLEEFLVYCDSLIRIDDSVGLLDKLQTLSLHGCENLKSIPPLKLPSLKKLHISECQNLESVPPLKLPSLKELNILSCHNLNSVEPVVDGLLGKLKYLTVDFCKKLKSISPLKLPLLEELSLSHCDCLESFPLVIDGSFGNLKSLRVVFCRNLKSFLQLKLASLETLVLFDCGSLETFLPLVDVWIDKLKVLHVFCCRFHRSMPPIKSASLEKLELSCDCCRDDVKENPGYLQHIEGPHWDDTPLKELPFSFQDLTCLQTLYLMNCGIVQFPTSSIVAMSKLVELTIEYGGWTFPIQSSRVELPSLEKLKLSNCDGLESFPPVFDVLMGNLKILHVGNCNNIKSIPPLKLPLLEELTIEYCDSLESFPLMMDGSLGNLKSLNVKSCRNLKSIPPLKLPFLGKLTLSNCDSLESFPVMMNGSLGKLKSLTVKSCRNLKSFLQLKLALPEKLDLSDCGSLENFLPLVDGWVGKLKVLRIICCHNHRSLPPIKFASLEELELSCYFCWDHIDEKSRWMGYIKEPHWDDTPLKELPFSFQDLTCLQTLYLGNCGIVQFPTSSIVGKSKQDKDEEKVISIPYSRVELLSLRSCNLSDESLAIGLKWFLNVKELDLSCSNITSLPECIKNCDSLWKLVMDYCEKLQEIKGIPPNTNTISAFNCSSLNSSCTSKLLNQELHKFGNTSFLLPGVEIPNWFDREYGRDYSFSFWFRNKFPAIVLCVVFPSRWSESRKFLHIKINNNGLLSYTDGNIHRTRHETNIHHLGLFPILKQKIHYIDRVYNGKHFVDVEKRYRLENKWNLVEVSFRFKFHKCGIYVLKESSSMEDIRFTNPENDVSM